MTCFRTLKSSKDVPYSQSSHGAKSSNQIAYTLECGQPVLKHHRSFKYTVFKHVRFNIGHFWPASLTKKTSQLTIIS